MLTSCFYLGSTRHRRSQPRIHDFQYQLFMAYLDLDELELINRSILGFSVNRWNALSFFDCDHMDGQPGSTRDKVVHFLKQHGITLSGGSIRLLTQCRIFGYVFNPISLFFCRDSSQRLVAIIVEVHNTFGERHLYLLECDVNANPRSIIKQQTAKALHVSPFITMDCIYDFRIAIPNEKLSLSILQTESGEPVLHTTLSGKLEPLTNGSALRVLARYPFTAIKTIGAIHAEAARLYFKGLPVISHPKTTPKQHTRETSSYTQATPEPKTHQAVSANNSGSNSENQCGVSQRKTT